MKRTVAAIASLLTGLVDDIDAVIAGVPVVDFPAMFHQQAPHRVRLRAVEHEQTCDLVVLAAEWGSGRRRGWLSNLHLGARDPSTGDFVMLGKTFKGMTDSILEWQTKELLARETHRDGHIVYVRPELVVEIAFNEVLDDVIEMIGEVV